MSRAVVPFLWYPAMRFFYLPLTLRGRDYIILHNVWYAALVRGSSGSSTRSGNPVPYLAVISALNGAFFDPGSTSPNAVQPVA